MKNTVLIILAVLVIVGLSVYAFVKPPSPQKSGGNSVLTADKTSFDFGTISMADGKIKYDFKIRNTSGRSIFLSKVYTSCMCTEANIISGAERLGPFGMLGHGGPAATINKKIEPNEEFTVETIFDPNAHGPAGIGKADRLIILETRPKSQLQLQITSLVTP